MEFKIYDLNSELIPTNVYKQVFSISAFKLL